LDPLGWRCDLLSKSKTGRGVKHTTARDGREKEGIKKKPWVFMHPRPMLSEKKGHTTGKWAHCDKVTGAITAAKIR